MKSRFFFFLCSLMAFAWACQETTPSTPPAKSPTTADQKPKNNHLSSLELDAGWRLLFDGQSMDQWRGYNQPNFPDEGWSIDAEGNLQVSASGTEEAGFGGDIITKEKFENFELQVDFMVSDTGNSGIFYRVLEMENAPIWHNAPEFQVLDNQTYIKMGGMDMNKHLTGDNYDLHASRGDYSRPVGEWNTARIRVYNNQVEHWLNGQQTVVYALESPDWEERVGASKFADYPAYGRTKQGAIGLQDHGHLVKFRNIKIRKL
ncbi:MAG: DUF1080 domain-containing protein [Bacteroidota bacterium]